MRQCVTPIPAASFREGRWLNGMGVSWDIAAEPPNASASDFGWRFAIARIDADVPFSRYTGVDRVFTLIDGEGLDLDVAGLGRIAVHERFVPHAFPGDADTACTLKGGPCRALNLFLRRGRWRAEIIVTGGPSAVGACDAGLVFALRGGSSIGTDTLLEGDTAIAGPTMRIAPHDTGALVYVAQLFREG
jgi:environmental stress-induced protein Ves